jgi:hypothetical protein
MSKASVARIAAVAVAVSALALGTAACDPSTDSAAPAKQTGASAGHTTAAASAPAKKKGDAKPKAKPAFKGDGTFQVGKDIRPGTYKSSGNSDGMCYWEREKDAKNDTDSILANGNVTGNSYVTIAASDKFFKSTGCDDWYAVPAASGAPKTSVAGDGMYKVGTDMAPGTYKSKGGDGCYWERDKDALHGVDSILANDNPTGAAVVTVTKSDKYFKSTTCAAWSKTG